MWMGSECEWIGPECVGRLGVSVGVNWVGLECLWVLARLEGCV